MRPTTTRVASAVAIGGLLTVGSIAAAAPASAAEQFIYTSTQYWEIEDTTGVSDYNYAGDYATSVEGWSGEAFDSAATLTVDLCSETYAFGEENLPDATEGVVSGASFVDGGLSSFVIDWDLETECGDETHVQATVTLEGNYAKWSYVFTGDPVDSASFGVDAYFDEDTLWENPTPDSAVAYTLEEGWQEDAPSAWKFASTGTDSELYSVDGDDELAYSVLAPTALTAIALIPDYSFGTGFDAALAYLVANAGTLDASFGASLGVFFGTDAPAYAAQNLTVGKSANGTVAYTYTPFDVEDGDEIDYFADVDTDDGETMGYELGTLPPGLSLVITFDATTGQPIVTLTGTPTTAGSYTVPVTYFYVFTDDGGNEFRFQPLSSSISFTVAAAAITPAASLPSTGADVAPFIGGSAALLLAGGAFLLIARKRRATV